MNRLSVSEFTKSEQAGSVENDLTVEKINAERITRVEEKIDRMITELPKIINEAFKAHGRTSGSQLSLMLSMAAVVVTIGLAMHSLAVSKIEANVKRIEVMDATIRAHELRGGHPPLEIRVKALETAEKEGR